MNEFKGRLLPITAKVTILIVMLVFPLNILSIWQTFNVSKEMVSRVKLMAENVSNKYVKDLETYMSNGDYLLYTAFNDNENCKELMKADNGSDYTVAKISFFREMKKQVSLMNAIDGFYFYMAEQDENLYYSKNHMNDPGSLDNRLKKLADTGKSEGWIVIPQEQNELLVRCGSVRNLYYAIFLDLEAVRKNIVNDLEYQDVTVSFSEKPLEQANKNQEVISVKSDKINLYLNISLNRLEILGGIPTMQRTISFIAFCYLLLIPLLYLLLNHLLIKPLKVIRNAHHEIEISNQEYRIEERANSSEFQYVYVAFNKMADNIKFLKIDNYEKEIARQKMELQNLQLQIRPHFLLNTFNIINVLAIRGKLEPIQETIFYLSNYFRYIFRSDKQLELFAKEYDLIKDYVKVSKVRYPDNIEDSYDIDPKAKCVRIPPLLVHNFVENAIKHAIIQGKIMHLHIKAVFKNNTVTFEITDDGMGMKQDVIKKINAYGTDQINAAESNEHLGFRNAIRRLHYFYGENYSLHIESELERGTCVTIMIPFYLGEEYESTDC